ncbi:OB-fold domain-containing protein [Streptomyces sp. NPDC020490]|uniref:protein kinase domain-containing protein n=1 Tax=Streptomyces sp. NPDC020490 TaxID=3365078 RepID=UPI0037B08333
MDGAGYRVYRRLSTTQWAKVSGSSLLTCPSFVDAPPATGQTFLYEVRAVDKAGHESAGSADVTAVTVDRTGPAAPTGLTAIGDDFSPPGHRPLWLATEYVAAPALSDWVAGHGPLPPAALRALAAELAAALAAVHACGLTHRDVKPSNVLLGRDRPMLIDFGIARAADDSRHTSTGGVIGSPGYLAPEQAAGGAVTEAGDIFSLGAVLVFAATGTGPFEHPGEQPSAASLLYRIVHEPPRLDGVPAELAPLAAARATGRPGVVAPASMVQAWTMRGYAATVSPAAGRRGFDELVELLDEGGYTSVVATDSELEFARELVPGDHVSVEEVVESISPEKKTGLGVGRFVTTVKTYRDQGGEVVATQRWRTLRFRPAAKPDTAATPDAAKPDTAEPDEAKAAEPRAPRPRPALNRDNAFWFEAAKEHRLVIQRCLSCETLRHPPGPCCPRCGSFEWDTVRASGRGHVHSFTVNHHPRHPAFDYPLVVAVVELAEGTRLITNLTGVAPEDVTVDMPVVLDWLDADPDLSLPVFRPVASEDR